MLLSSYENLDKRKVKISCPLFYPTWGQLPELDLLSIRSYFMSIKNLCTCSLFFRQRALTAAYDQQLRKLMAHVEKPDKKKYQRRQVARLIIQP